MAKTVRDFKLDSPAARSRLKASGKPYYRSIDTGLHLGYRKGKTGGRWVVRIYLGDEKYVVETIGAADDRQDADGGEVLNFSQAQAKSREIAGTRRRPKGATGPLTVSTALDAYLERLESEHRRSTGDVRNRIENHIRPRLGNLLVAELSREAIVKWLKALAEQPKQVRGKKGKPSRALAKPKTDDQKRQRRTSANRTLTILRAALNQAFRDNRGGQVSSDSAWRAVQPFRGVDAARIRYFTADEVRRLVNAARGEFRSLVNAALFTGCRYGELSRLRAADFSSDSGTLFVAESKSGKARHVVLTDEGQTFFAQLVAGRPSDALMLPKEDGTAWGASHQARPMLEACTAAKIARAGFHALRHTAASHLVMSGVPLPVVAKNLGHADSRMCEHHYAHLAPSYVAETIRRFAPVFGTVQPKTKVVSIDRARG